MANMLQAGAAWLAGKLKAHAGTVVEYRRGDQAVTLTATRGRTLLKLADDLGGVRMEWTDRDYLIAAANLVLGGSTVLPARADVIADVEGGATHLYEVLAPGGETPWRWSDPGKTLLRIHCKYMGVEA